jgi:hypothetical protein
MRRLDNAVHCALVSVGRRYRPNQYKGVGDTIVQ